MKYTLNKWSNGTHSKRNAYPRQNGPLDNGQKARLCILAREAFALQFTDADFTDWRREEQFKAVGKLSLRDCTQADYKRLEARFLRLGGEEGDAMRAETRAGTEDKRLAFYKLEEACTGAGLAMSYAAAICRNQFKCGLNEATAKQLWNLMFTIRNRRKSKHA